MTFTLTINTDSAAFEDNVGAAEIARVLREAANKIERNFELNGVVRDVNGNKCGGFTTAAT